MKKILPFLLLLAACGRGDEPANDQAAPGPGGPVASNPGAASPAASARAGLAGLYEGGSGAQKNQMCIVEKGGGEAEFGLLVWGSNMHSCSGAGRASRSGDRLTLTMTGDETCTIQATLKDGTVTLPGPLPLGCAYYCGARASLGGARFTRSGEDVKRARDIAGDPLCD